LCKFGEGVEKKALSPKIIGEIKTKKKGERAIFILAQSNDKRVLPLMIELAQNSQNPKIQQQAIFWLGQRREPETKEALFKLYETLTDTKTKERVIFSLVQSRDKTTRKKLLSLLRKEKDERLREQLIFWLGNVRDPEITTALLKLFDESQDPKLKERLLRSLSLNASQDKRIKEKFISIIKNSRDTRLREIAVLQLSHVGGQEIIPLFRNLYFELTPEETKLKRYIIFALGNLIKYHQANQALIEIARQEKDPHLLKNIIFSLRRSKNKEAVKFLEEIINR